MNSTDNEREQFYALQDGIMRGDHILLRTFIENGYDVQYIYCLVYKTLLTHRTLSYNPSTGSLWNSKFIEFVNHMMQAFDVDVRR
jgi:hypothetical protein